MNKVWGSENSWDPNIKWIFSKPRSGLNDVLCQLEKTLGFAEKYDRNVVTETKNSSLLLPLDQVFESISSEVSIFPSESKPNLVSHLNSLSCSPKELGGHVDTYHAARYQQNPPEAHVGPVLWQRSSWKKDASQLEAGVIVHESGGGAFPQKVSYDVSSWRAGSETAFFS